MRQQVEILAPAGSFESMVAAINAGADAVYMGGSRFGARAYAENPEGDRFLEAIDYAHLHGCKLYMTVNTLVKETELDALYEFLLPIYQRGVDAFIIQDMGVFDFVRKHFPDVHIHASTQMTVTSYRSAKRLKELGAARVVTARELSLEEIAQIRDNVDIEIESFVHGALCYCYSGQCLMSSLIGGRSGNRGRCAQPCRLPYEVLGQQRQEKDNQAQARQWQGRQTQDKSDKSYILSLKDLCTLDILPDIIESGVYSLKIEGRMKSPRYTAGVVSIYRKYVDAYLANGREGYKVDPKDKKMLLELFDRGGFTDGYYVQHNGKDMVATKEKPEFRQGNQELFDRLDETYVNVKMQEPTHGHLIVEEGKPIQLTLRKRGVDDGGDIRDIEISVTGDVVQSAQNQPLTEEKLRKQITKTGSSSFYFDILDVTLTGNCFLPVQAMNEIRREALSQLEEAILSGYRRKVPVYGDSVNEPIEIDIETEVDAKNVDIETEINVTKQESKYSSAPRVHVSLENPDTLESALGFDEVSEIYLDSNGFSHSQWKQAVKRCHDVGKSCGLILPNIFRTEAADYFNAHRKELKEAGFDTFILRSMEEIGYLKEIGLEDVPKVFDANLYQTNHLAALHMEKEGENRLTYPIELNMRELEKLRDGLKEVSMESMPCEFIGYGHIPVMVSAQCVCRTTKGCEKKPQTLYLKDRTGKKLPVKNYCQFCYNVIYNPSPLWTLGQKEVLNYLKPDVIRLSFTVESQKQVENVIGAYVDEVIYGRESALTLPDFTRGHLKRGVE